MLVSKTLEDPMQTPGDTQRDSVEYRWRSLALGLKLAMYISCCLCQFHLRCWIPNTNAFSVEYRLYKAAKKQYLKVNETP